MGHLGLAIRQEALGADHPAIATTLRGLGTVLFLRGDSKGAEPLLRQALEIRRHNFGRRDARVAAAESSLGRALHALGRVEEAEKLLTTALDTRQSLLGQDHPHVALTKKDLVALRLDQKPVTAEAVVDAEARLTEVLAILRAWKPEGSWEIAEAKSLLGVCRKEQGRYEEAEPFLIDGYQHLRNLRGPEAIYTRNAHRRLVDLYAAWGRPLPAGLL